VNGMRPCRFRRRLHSRGIDAAAYASGSAGASPSVSVRKSPGRSQQRGRFSPVSLVAQSAARVSGAVASWSVQCRVMSGALCVALQLAQQSELGWRELDLPVRAPDAVGVVVEHDVADRHAGPLVGLRPPAT
jgi:hypothetical protein